jgi:hypothetical protein
MLAQNPPGNGLTPIDEETLLRYLAQLLQPRRGWMQASGLPRELPVPQRPLVNAATGARSGSRSFALAPALAASGHTDEAVSLWEHRHPAALLPPPSRARGPTCPTSFSAPRPSACGASRPCQPSAITTNRGMGL